MDNRNRFYPPSAVGEGAIGTREGAVCDREGAVGVREGAGGSREGAIGVAKGFESELRSDANRYLVETLHRECEKCSGEANAQSELGKVKGAPPSEVIDGGGGIRTPVRKYIPAGIYDAYPPLKSRARREETAKPPGTSPEEISLLTSEVAVSGQPAE